MAKLNRQTQLIFASLAGNRELTAFGTAKTETPEYTIDVNSIQNSNYLQGWSSAILADKAPYEEDTNGLLYMITRQLAYLYNTGIAEYDSATEYNSGSYCISADGTGTIYKSLKDNNIGNPISDTTSWQLINLNKRQFPLFTQITLDYVLQGDDAIGYALQGSLVNGNVYPEAFNKILNLYNAGSAASYRGINAVLTSDGRYITSLNNKNAVDNLYNNTGTADIYVLDASTQSFYLPKNSNFIQYTANTSLANKYTSAGLPAPQIILTGEAETTSAGIHDHGRGGQNITGAFSGVGQKYSNLPATLEGAFYQKNTSNRPPEGVAIVNDNGAKDDYFGFDASRSWTGRSSREGTHKHTFNLSSITASASGGLFGTNNTVQPASSTRLLYYLVGDTVS